MRLPRACRNGFLVFSDIRRKRVSRSFSGACRGRVFPDACSSAPVKTIFSGCGNAYLPLRVFRRRFGLSAGFSGCCSEELNRCFAGFPAGRCCFSLLFSARQDYPVWRQTVPTADCTELLLRDCGEKTAGVRPAYSDRHILSKNKTR